MPIPVYTYIMCWPKARRTADAAVKTMLSHKHRDMVLFYHASAIMSIGRADADVSPPPELAPRAQTDACARRTHSPSTSPHRPCHLTALTPACTALDAGDSD